MIYSHFNNLYNAYNGFDLEAIEKMSDNSLKYFMENMTTKDLMAFSKAIDISSLRLKEIKKKIEIYITFS